MVFFSSGLLPAGFSLCLLAVMLVMFWQERFPSEVIALSDAALFLVTGILPHEAALLKLSNAWRKNLPLLLFPNRLCNRFVAVMHPSQL